MTILKINEMLNSINDTLKEQILETEKEPPKIRAFNGMALAARQGQWNRSFDGTDLLTKLKDYKRIIESLHEALHGSTDGGKAKFYDRLNSLHQEYHKALDASMPAAEQFRRLDNQLFIDRLKCAVDQMNNKTEHSTKIKSKL